MPVTASGFEKMLSDVRMMRKKMGEVELPEKSKLLVIPTVAFEWWGLVAEGKGSNAFKTIAPFPEASNKLNLSEISLREFGGTVGAGRMLEILERHKLKASWVTSGNVVDKYPDIVREAASLGHEFIAHQYDHDTVYLRLTREEEQEDVRKTVSAFERTMPGWKRNGWVGAWWLATPHTLDILTEERFVTHSDFLNDELPYTIDVRGKRIVEVPHSPGVNDVLMEPEMYKQRFKSTFSYLYALGKAGHPRIFNFAVHPFIAGRPHWATVFEEVVEFAQSFSDVWFAERIEVGNWWLNEYPEGKVTLQQDPDA